MRRVALIGLLLLSGLALGRQGNMGGSAQDRQGGSVAPQNVRPEDQDAELWTERTAIVTPGDRVEYKFELKKGETVFAAAESDAFDVALAFADAKEKELARNDDREEGDQSPFLTFRAPEAGTYSLRVLGFRSAAGGRFTLKFRTFLPLDAPRGVATLPRAIEPNDRPASPGYRPVTDRAIVRVVAKKDEIVDLRVDGTAADGSRRYLQYLRVVGPTGVERADLASVRTPDGSRVFRAKADGDYFVEFEANGATSLRTDLRAVAVSPVKTTEDVSVDLAPGELKIVQFPVVADQIVRTTIVPGEFRWSLNAVEGTFSGRAQEGDGGYGNTVAWTWFRPDRNSANDNVRIFHGKGTVAIAVRSTSDKAQRVAIRNSESLPEWTPDKAFTGELPIAGSRFYLLKAGKADFSTASAKGERFEIDLDFFRLDGTLEFSMIDRVDHAPRRELFFPGGATYLVRVACEGFGGAGSYAIRRDSPPVSDYRLGATESFHSDSTGLRFFSVDLEGGKLYQLLGEGSLPVQMIGADGAFVPVQTLRFDRNDVQYFVPARTGRYRLLFRGEGRERFRLAPTVVPTLGAAKP